MEADDSLELEAVVRMDYTGVLLTVSRMRKPMRSMTGTESYADSET